MDVNTVVLIKEDSEISRVMSRPYLFKAVDDIEECVNIVHPSYYIIMAIAAAVCLPALVSCIKEGNYIIAALEAIILLTPTAGLVRGITAHKRMKQSHFAVKDFPNTFYFYDDCYVNTDRISLTCIRYEWVMGLRETKDAFLINIDGQSVHVIPKKAVKEGNVSELSAFLAERTAKKQKGERK